MTDLEKAFAIIDELGPRVAEAIGIIGSVAAAAEVLKRVFDNEKLDPAMISKIDAEYRKVFAELIATP